MTHTTRLVMLTLSLAACGGSPMAADDDTSPDAGSAVDPVCQEATTHSDLTWIQDNVFTKSCVFGGCHASPANDAGHLVLSAGMSASQLVGKPTQTATPWMRVIAGEPDMSYLLVALDSAAGPEPAGGYMPLSSPALCSEKRAAISRWITAGATDD